MSSYLDINLFDEKCLNMVSKKISLSREFSIAEKSILKKKLGNKELIKQIKIKMSKEMLDINDVERVFQIIKRGY